jgi:hypothetical protein
MRTWVSGPWRFYTACVKTAATWLKQSPVPALGIKTRGNACVPAVSGVRFCPSTFACAHCQSGGCASLHRPTRLVQERPPGTCEAAQKHAAQDRVVSQAKPELDEGLSAATSILVTRASVQQQVQQQNCLLTRMWSSWHAVWCADEGEGVWTGRRLSWLGA